MVIYFSDESLAELIMNPIKLRERFGPESAEKILKGMTVVEAASDFEQVASLGAPAAYQCHTTGTKQFCVQIDQSYALTFQGPLPAANGGQSEAEVVRLDRSCPKFTIGNQHG